MAFLVFMKVTQLKYVSINTLYCRKVLPFYVEVVFFKLKWSGLFKSRSGAVF